MDKSKIFEWIGFIIVVVLIFANRYIRANGITKGIEINLTLIGVIFIIRKFWNRGV